MTLRVYTLRGKMTDALYVQEAHTKNEAARKLGIRPSLLIIEYTQKAVPHRVQLRQPKSISPYTAQYHSPRK